MRFDRIVDAVANGEVDAGLIIHESRFTYRDADWSAIVDLGEWWEDADAAADSARRDSRAQRPRRRSSAKVIDDAMRGACSSRARTKHAIMPYVREHAIEMDDDVMRKHIGLYVNDFSEDVGQEGVAAVDALFARAHEAGIIPETTEPRFV